SETILKRLINPIACSFLTLCDAISVLFFLSSFVSGFFLLFFFGKSVLLSIYCRPWYPESTMTCTLLCTAALDCLYNLKSCFLPFAKYAQIISWVFLSTTSCVFNVCLFFLPE